MEESEAGYRQAIQIYDELAKEDPESETQESDYWEMKRGLAVVLIGQSKISDAEKAFSEVVAGRQRQVHRFPKIPGFRLSLAGSLNDLGIFYARSGQLDVALEKFTASLEINKAIAAENPEILSYRRLLAYDYNNLAPLHESLGDSKEAVNCHRNAYRLRKELADESPQMQGYRAELAVSASGLGEQLYGQPGQEVEARRLMGEAIGLLSQLTTESPEVPIHRHKLAIAKRSLAMALVDTEPDEATRITLDSIEILAGLATENAGDPKYTRHGAFSHQVLGSLQLNEGDDDAAVQSYRKAESMLGSISRARPEDFEFRQNFAEGSLRLARALDAVELHVEAADQFRQSLESWRALLEEIPDNRSSQSQQASTRSAYARFLSLSPDLTQRDAALAKDLAKKAAEFDEEDPEFLATLALACYRLNETNDAMQAIEKAISLRTDSGRESEWLIKMLILQSQDEDASSAFEEANRLRDTSREDNDRLDAEFISRLRNEVADLPEDGDGANEL